MNLANSKSLLMVRPSNNRGRVDNSGRQFLLHHYQSSHKRRNVPFNSTLQFRNLVHHRNIGMLTLGTFHAILL